jgi:hypothetical protein
MVLAVHIEWQNHGTVTGLTGECIPELIFAENGAIFSRRPQ